MPANRRAWPEGFSYYHYDALYDRRNLGYRGPGFGLPPMPDQYTLQALQRLELAKRDRPPLFAEVDLISSHAPWTRIPRLIPWDDVGDGSIFERIPPAESTQAALFGDGRRAREAYGRSIEYSLRTLMTFVQRYGDDDTVLVVLGDHQPATLVSGQGADHDVPISVIAHDPKVMDQIAGWGWQDGMLPSPACAGLADGRVPRPLPHRVRVMSRWRFEPALDRARVSAYAPGEFVGQEGFMTAAEISTLGARAGIGPGVAVLDVCCGTGGPGRLLTGQLGCAYLGVDESALAVTLARERTNGVPCRFAVAQVPPLPAGSFDVVLLLEAMLAFEDKDALVRDIAAALRPGGRFAFTLEAGSPLTTAERAAMPPPARCGRLRSPT